MPDSFTLVVNTEHPVVKQIMEEARACIGSDVDSIFASLSDSESKLKAVNAEVKDSKPSDEQQKQITELQEQMSKSRSEIAAKAADFGKTQPKVRQVIDLSLLAFGLLKGKELSEFVKRSVALL